MKSRTAVGLLCVTLLAPLLLVDVPPLLDYPNHLARAMVLAFGAADPVLSRMYVAHWAVIPNLGTDLVLPPLLHVLPIHLAGRIVVGIAILLPVIGTIAYSRVTFGTNAMWPLASGLVAYNFTLLLGFLDFGAGLGIALLLAAGWIARRERNPGQSVALAGIGTTALFFCHLMGLVFFYILIAGHELQRLWSCRRQPWVIARRLAALIALTVVPLGLYLIAPLAAVGAQAEMAPLAYKARQLLFPFVNYVWPLDLVTGCLVAAFLLACTVTGHCRITWNGSVALLLTAGLYLLTPWAFKGTYFFDTRFAIMFGFLLFAAVLPTAFPRMTAFATVSAFTLLFGVRMAVIGFVWHAHRQDVAELRATIATVEPGARVFVTSVSPDEAPRYWRDGPLGRRLSDGTRVDYHLAALLLLEHRAFWPFLFDDPAQQPVATLEPYRTLANRVSADFHHRALAQPGKVDLCGYDDLLLLEAGAQPDLAHFAANRLTLVARSDFAALFRVIPSACAY